MSYDLYFCREKKERVLTYSEFTKWAAKYNFFTETEWADKENNKTKLINYENPNTGVYFQLEYGIYSDEWEDWEENPASNEYTKPNLYLRLNVPRPSYFVIETASAMSWMCRDLGLFMVDTQTTGLPEPFSVKGMVGSWMSANEFATQIINQKKLDYVYWSESEATSVWEYNFYPPDFLNEYPDCIASNIEGVVQQGQKKMRLMTRWLKGAEIALPKADFIMLFDPKKTTKTVLYSEVMKALGPLAEPIASRRKGTIIIKKENVKETDKIFEQLMRTAKEVAVEAPNCTVIDIDMRWYKIKKWISILVVLAVIFSAAGAFQKKGVSILIEKSHTAWVGNDAEGIVRYANMALNIAIDDKQKSAAWYWLGVGKYRMGKFDEAIAWELKAKEADPSNSGPLVTLGGAYLAKEDFEKALEYGKRAVEISPGSEWAHNLLGLAYWAKGNTDEGIRELRLATEINPNQPIIAENYRRITGGKP